MGSRIGSFQGIGGWQAGAPGDAGTRLTSLISTVIGLLTIVAGLAFLLYFILAAIGWITSNGDAAKIEAAKSQMTSAAIGLVIIVVSYAIIGVVGSVLGLDILFVNTDLSTIIEGSLSPQ